MCQTAPRNYLPCCSSSVKGRFHVSSDFLRRWSKLSVTLLSVVLLAAQARGAGNSISCVGDCNGDGYVTVDEIIAGIAIAVVKRAANRASTMACHSVGLFPNGGKDRFAGALPPRLRLAQRQ